MDFHRFAVARRSPWWWGRASCAAGPWGTERALPGRFLNMVRPIDTSLEQRLPLSTDVALQRRFMVGKEPPPGDVRYGPLLEGGDKLAQEGALRHARRTDPPADVGA